MFFLERLTTIDGVSGNEDEVRRYISETIVGFIDPASDRVETDTTGNLIIKKSGTKPRFKVMVCAHMDEVGLMITGYDDFGYLRFRTVGNIDQKILPGKRVRIGNAAINGIIGIKPVHFKKSGSAVDHSANNINNPNKMYIDIGAQNRDEAHSRVKIGDYAAFDTSFEMLGDDCAKAKALDDRSGCSVLMDILKERYSFDLYACFTVQEEIGLRGSETAAYTIMPDVAFVIEGTTCFDVPNADEDEYATMLGRGTAITVMDKGCFPDRNLLSFIRATAHKYGLPMQYRQTTAASNDASSIQKSRSGVKVASLSVPCRYIHSPASVLSVRDLVSCRQFLDKILRELSDDQERIRMIKDGGAVFV